MKNIKLQNFNALTFIYSPHSILLETEIKLFSQPLFSLIESLKEK